MQKELEVIMELMEDLQDKMSMREGDFDERLGRNKPQVDVVKIEGELPLGDDEMDEDEDDEVMEMASGPASLKDRIAKMRG